MLQEVPIMHPKTQKDGVTTQPIPLTNPRQPTYCWKGLHAQLAAAVVVEQATAPTIQVCCPGC